MRTLREPHATIEKPFGKGKKRAMDVAASLRLGLCAEVVDVAHYRNAVRSFREHRIVLPTFAQLANQKLATPLPLADLAGVDAERLRFWTFARAAADPRDDWTNTRWIEIAKALSS